MNLLFFCVFARYCTPLASAKAEVIYRQFDKSRLIVSPDIRTRFFEDEEFCNKERACNDIANRKMISSNVDRPRSFLISIILSSCFFSDRDRGILINRKSRFSLFSQRKKRRISTQPWKRKRETWNEILFPAKFHFWWERS